MAVTVVRALEELRRAAGDGRLARLAGEHDLDLVTVFGSAVDAARTGPGERPPEDLDVAVRRGPATPGAAGLDLVAVRAALVDLLDHEGVDLLDLGRAGVVARSRALGPGAEPLFEVSPGVWARAQMAALAEEMETERLRRWDLSLLAAGGGR